ncbi:MAG: PEP-CTERM sorting domain-containing protein [Verrucomicrobiales bacterium]|nr:PEP-CTERM sorting domain-containing protein [Verrucomicrobiales bacterium]
MNRNCRRVGLSMIGAASLIVGSFSGQSAVVYSSLSSFNSAIQGGAYVEDMESFTAGQAGSGVTSLDFSGGTGPIQYTISADPDELYFSESTGGNQALTTLAFESPLVITFTSANITAVGGEFHLLGGDENPANGLLSVTLNDGSTFSTNITSHASGGLDYLGFTTTAPNFIQSITLGTSSGLYTAVDNLTVGFAAVPEPAVIASLSAVGLFSFGLARRHFRGSRRRS